MKEEFEAELVSKIVLGKGNVFLTFSCGKIAREAMPGQFVNVSCSRFLRRPFGVCTVDREAGTFSIGVREVGTGTREITEARIGDMFEILGPLGRGFCFDGIGKLIAVGGGTGIFPLYFALQEAGRRGIPSICVNGFRSRQESFLLEECEHIAGKVLYSTDSGDLGIHGTVIDALSRLDPEEVRNASVFVVGPEIMMRKVSEWAAGQGLACQVSMERRMACGIGICLVCVCKVKAEEEGVPFHHVRCCKEGPVMNASEVLW